MKRIHIMMLVLLLAACGSTDSTESVPDATDTPVSSQPNVTVTTMPPVEPTSVQTSLPASDTSPTISPTDAQSPTELPDIETGFNAQVTGAIEITIDDAGYFQCETVNGGELNVAPSLAFSDTVLLSLPRDITAGTYSLSSPGTQPDVISAEFYGEDVITDTFDRDVEGVLVLERVPDEAGEPVVGTFEFQAGNADDDTSVQVSGTFNFEAGEAAFRNCDI